MSNTDKTAQATPGPWHATPPREFGIVLVHAPKTADRVKPVASCPSEPGERRVAEANARLIAQAPAFLAACTPGRIDALDALLERTERTWSPESTQAMRESCRALLRDLRLAVTRATTGDEQKERKQ